MTKTLEDLTEAFAFTVNFLRCSKSDAEISSLGPSGRATIVE